MINIRTFLLVDKNFIPLEEFSGSFRDKYYIDGGITLSIYNTPVLTLEMWDLVDLLWVNIVDQLEAIALGQTVVVCFPDCPLQLLFQPIGVNSVNVKTNAKNSLSAMAPKDMLISCLCSSGWRFFKRMMDLAPAHSGIWLASLDKIEKVSKSDFWA
ncbi:hypothetical protein [Desulfatibacillum aliphaticivorans]|uniref:hypothetical protein n=1 Tax=Desulfatibacillum aliphaticivorans TaxID=218208 RepID=UPI00047FC7E1|nr:hypothetical protein [Desulfatibacillum aliphaticivorans]